MAAVPGQPPAGMQQAPPAAAPAGPPPPLHEGAGPPAEKVHALAVKVAAGLSGLGTMLAQLNADPSAVKAVGSMEQVMHKIITAMGKAAQNEPPPAPKTMGGATNSLAADLAAQRSNGGQ